MSQSNIVSIEKYQNIVTSITISIAKYQSIAIVLKNIKFCNAYSKIAKYCNKYFKISKYQTI